MSAPHPRRREGVPPSVTDWAARQPGAAHVVVGQSRIGVPVVGAPLDAVMRPLAAAFCLMTAGKQRQPFRFYEVYSRS